MDPFTFVAGSLAIIFGLLALLQWRRAEDLEARVRELEGKGPPEPEAETEEKAEAKAEPAREEAEEEEEEAAAAPKEPPSEPELAPPPKAASEPPPKAASEPPPPKAASEPPPKAASEPPPKAASEPPVAAAPKSEPPPQPEPDNTLRLEALKVVADAFELARYLDFDAIVEKPATYRVTVPITASNSKAVRFLEEGMFACLKHVSIEDRNAVLHIDTTKGPP